MCSTKSELFSSPFYLIRNDISYSIAGDNHHSGNVRRKNCSNSNFRSFFTSYTHHTSFHWEIFTVLTAARISSLTNLHEIKYTKKIVDKHEQTRREKKRKKKQETQSFPLLHSLPRHSQSPHFLSFDNKKTFLINI